MKKLIYFAAALAIVGAASCNKELVDNNAPEVPEVKLATLTATIGEPDTKTTLATPEDAYTNGSEIHWAADDALSVFDGTNNAEYTIKVEEGVDFTPATTAVFEGAELEEAEGYYALYPYTAGATLEAGVIKGAVLPATQEAVAGNIPAGAALAVAYTEDRSEIHFKNVATIIGFTLTEAAEKVEFVAKGGEALAGKVDVTPAKDAAPTYTVQAETGSNKVTLENLKAGTYYFTILPDVTLTQGYEFYIDEVLAKSNTKELTLVRSKIYSLGEVVKPASWGICGTMTNWTDGSDVSMAYDGNTWYIAEGVTIKASDAFQFRLDNKWDVQKTYVAGEVVENTEYELVNGAGGVGDIKVAVSAIYDVYLNKDASKFKIVKVDDIPLPPVKNWGVVGSMTDWGNDKVMTVNGDWYVASAVEMPENTTFKFRVDGKWASEGGEELTYTGGDAADGNEHLVSTGSDNITVNAAGIYDVYLSRDETKMKMVKVGEYVAPEPDPEPEDPNPSTTKTIYLKPGVWDVDGAKFVAYSWIDGGSSSFALLKVTANTSYYSCEISNEHTKVIFLRKSNSNLDWSGEWNRVGDLTLPTDGKNCCEITGWSGTNYKWSVYSE